MQEQQREPVGEIGQKPRGKRPEELANLFRQVLVVVFLVSDEAHEIPDGGFLILAELPQTLQEEQVDSLAPRLPNHLSRTGFED